MIQEMTSFWGVQNCVIIVLMLHPFRGMAHRQK